MTDLHCHILPGIDDGAQDVNISLAMLRMEAEQGVGTVCLTPHFYRDQERPSSFFRRRQHALDQLLEALPEDMDTRLILASEVAWVQNIAEWPELPQFCYGGTNYILIEPPFTAWSSAFITSLYEIMDRRGLIPVIAHIERYLDRRNTSALSELYSMNLPIQLSATQFIRRFWRKNAISLLKSGKARHIISDAHNITSRPPNLGSAVAILQEKLGSEAATFSYQTDKLMRRAEAVQR